MNIQQAQYDPQANTVTEMYQKIYTAINDAIAGLPTYKSTDRGPKRKVSKETKSLYDQRTQLQNPTKKERKELQKKIRESGLNDFKEWVEECAETLTQADNVGDTKKIYNMVKSMEGKKEKPPKNLTTNKQGQLLTSATEVAAAWFHFLKEKFRATDAEQDDRPPMEPLPVAQGRRSAFHVWFTCSG